MAQDSARANRVTWAGDLGNSSNAAQYIKSISGDAGNGGTVLFNTNSLEFAFGQSSPFIAQATTSSGSGTTLTIQAQGASGLSHNGGNLNLSSGTSSSATAGTVNIQTGGITRISILPTSIQIPSFSSAGVVHNDSSGNLSTGLIVNSDLSPSAAVSVNKLSPGTVGQILITNSTPSAAWVSMSNDAVISNTGIVTVTGLQTRGVSSVAPTNGEVLAWVNTQWAPKAFSSLLTVQVKNSSYTVLTTDGDIFCDLSTTSWTLSLPTSPLTGEKHIIKDYLGFAATNHLTISGNGKLIEQSAGGTGSSLILNQNYSVTTLEYNGSFWSIM